MSDNGFNRDEMARRYANRHLKTDPGIQVIYYLPMNAPNREIRFVEVNEWIVQRHENPLEAIDFGVDVSGESAHRLLVVDVTPAQWEKIKKEELALPAGWSLNAPMTFERSDALPSVTA